MTGVKKGDRMGEGNGLERAWWLRSLLVLQAPRPVFAALRDDSDETAAARQEPVTALAFLGGIAAVLASGVAGGVLDEPGFDRLLVPFWVVFAGAAQALGSYWIGGGFLHAALKGLGAEGTYRRARHLLAFAAAPLALSLLLVWPPRLAVFGSDLFREGGGDSGVGGAVFEVAEAIFAVWALVLLALGVRIVHGWTWGRSIAACALAAVVLVAVGLAFAGVA
jgi:hypothetical protein